MSDTPSPHGFRVVRTLMIKVDDDVHPNWQAARDAAEQHATAQPHRSYTILHTSIPVDAIGITATGKLVTDHDIEVWADEAERGYIVGGTVEEYLAVWLADKAKRPKELAAALVAAGWIRTAPPASVMDGR